MGLSLGEVMDMATSRRKLPAIPITPDDVSSSLTFIKSLRRRYVTCSNEMSHMSKKIFELVTPLERRHITLPKGVNIMDISHTQLKLLDAEHYWGRKFQTEKNVFEVCGHICHGRVHCRSKIGRFDSITPFDAFEINSQVMFIVVDIPC